VQSLQPVRSSIQSAAAALVRRNRVRVKGPDQAEREGANFRRAGRVSLRLVHDGVGVHRGGAAEQLAVVVEHSTDAYSTSTRRALEGSRWRDGRCACHPINFRLLFALLFALHYTIHRSRIRACSQTSRFYPSGPQPSCTTPGARVPKWHSNPIANRIRRRRQRLPSNVLIENALISGRFSQIELGGAGGIDLKVCKSP
jgi:hypothetical protein